jgi:hypothetical protein
VSSGAFFFYGIANGTSLLDKQFRLRMEMLSNTVWQARGTIIDSSTYQRPLPPLSHPTCVHDCHASCVDNTILSLGGRVRAWQRKAKHCIFSC